MFLKSRENLLTLRHFLWAVIAAIPFAASAGAEELSPPVYEKKATWAETMLAASDSSAAFRKQLDELNAKLGLNAVRVQPWQWVEGPDLGAPPAHPRMDMPGARAIPQERNFGKVF